jgi:hypothetical protein
MSLPPDEGDLCGVNGCTGTFQILPPMDTDWRSYGCSCHISPPCGWCVSHELRCTDCSILPEEIEVLMDTLVSLDIQPESCEPENLLRISPELHFPLNEVFEVPDEFNGHQRGTFYYRNARGNLRGPFMNTEEAGFDLCRHQYSRGFPCS